MAELVGGSPVLAIAITLFEIAGWVVAIGVWFFYKVRQEADKHQVKLISALQDRIELLEGELKEYKSELEKISARNTVMEELLLKMGPEDKKYREQALKAMKQIEEMHRHQLQGGK